MSNTYELRKTLAEKYGAEHPGSMDRKKTILFLLLLMAAVRALHAVLNTAQALFGGQSAPAAALITPFLMVLMLLIVAYLIYAAGMRLMCWLAILNGAVSLHSAYSGGILAMSATADFLQSAADIVFLAAMFVQILAGLFIFFEPKCRAYTHAMANVHRQVIAANKT